ncbi:MAG: YbaK/EbsC family protein [Acidimicrobiaceae bacterium]|nr:YbaK/EbsC family protein [Acidimicrobiaceae bacterium]
MPSAKSSAAERFEQAAAALGVDADIKRFPEGTRTAADAAAAVGCDLGQIVKSLVFECDGEPVLALTSGAERVDTSALGRLIGGIVTKASADTVKTATGYSIGGTPPFGHSNPLRTFIDASLLRYDIVWAAAGTPELVFALPSSDLARITSGAAAEFTIQQPPAPQPSHDG